MMKKTFTYRGKTLDELNRMSLAELAELLPSDSRRKIHRHGDKEKHLMDKIQKSKKPVKTHVRSMVILPFMIGKTVQIHDGKSYQPIIITEEMIGHVLGEYSMTRKRITHSAPGVGATKSSANLSVK